MLKLLKLATQRRFRWTPLTDLFEVIEEERSGIQRDKASLIELKSFVPRLWLRRPRPTWRGRHMPGPAAGRSRPRASGPEANNSPARLPSDGNQMNITKIFKDLKKILRRSLLRS